METELRTDNPTTFKINVAADVLNDLQQRLKKTRWSYHIEGTGWDSGTDVASRASRGKLRSSPASNRRPA
jgi:hypothetical protein